MSVILPIIAESIIVALGALVENYTLAQQKGASNVYAIRMAEVFMLSLGVIWIRTNVMPRLFVILTFALAVLSLLISSITFWLILVFPAWVFVISMFILLVSLRGEQAEAEGIIGSSELS